MDTYIDNQETQDYGPKLRKNLKRAFATTPKPVAKFIEWLIEAQKGADEQVASAMTKARGKSSASSRKAQDKAPALKTASTTLSAFRDHLSSKAKLGEWHGRLRDVFPKSLGDGKSVPFVKAALGAAQGALEEDGSIPDRAAWKKRLDKAATSLDTLAGESGEALEDARSSLSEQSKEKQRWSDVYAGGALIADGLLLVLGRRDERGSLTPHLAVAGKAKGKGKQPKTTPTDDAKKT